MILFILAKPLDQAKQRLAPLLDADQRAALAAAMLTDVMIQALAARSVDHVRLLTSDAVLADLARRQGVEPVFEGVPAGLNAAANLALFHARAVNEGGLIILPADLPLATAASIDALSHDWDPRVVRAVEARDGGTNALVLDPSTDWRFVYGADSFAGHRSVARALDVRFEAARDDGLAFDVDQPDDLTSLRRTQAPVGRSTAAALQDLHRAEGGRRWA